MAVLNPDSTVRGSTDSVGVDDAMRAQALAALDSARRQTLRLMDAVDPNDAAVQHDPLMSPLVWDLGHIASFEALWLLRNLNGPIEFSEMPGTYNPFEHPRAQRGELSLPLLADAVAMLGDVRRQVVDRAASVTFDPASPLLRHAYVYHMVAQHEWQHQETMLQTLQLKPGTPYRPPRVMHPPEAVAPVNDGAMVRCPGGTFAIGTDDSSWAYDNERPRHAVTVSAFDIDTTAVTNGAFQRFVDGGGYRDRSFWSDAGWAWLQESGVEAPKHWTRDGKGWSTRMMDLAQPLDPSRPVCHVCYHEADAYARAAGKRLPTETEWEVALTYDPVTGSTTAVPPSDPLQANIGQLTFQTAPVWSYARNISPIGCYGMIGDVWEWTSSDFSGYPGFAPFPYPEYSEAFFGTEYKVLRGGSWATSASVARGSFRNWDYPIRRQIFSGFRCARDV